MSTPVLSVRLSVDYPGRPAVLKEVALEVYPEEVVGLIGRSGSGKSTMALSILRLLGLKGGTAHGEIRFRGRDLMLLSEREMRHLRGREIGLVLQSPLAALNPALRIGTLLRETWRIHARGDGSARIRELLQSVDLPAADDFLSRYPSQLSVGQAQRVVIAMALMHRPSLLLADEPTSALDPITQADILELFGRISQDFHTAILYISHDLQSIASLCHRVAILEGGVIVECGDTRQVFQNPTHPYTRRLIEALPKRPEWAEASLAPLPARATR
jgi:ABC-type dipeptide/oligopeptide/nickel transport system ATPase component